MALKERTVVLTGVDADGNTTIDMPITTADNVENLKETCLPLSGGTITGELRFNCGCIVSTDNDEYKETWFSAGQAWGEGGILTLYHKDSPDDLAGGFTLGATNDNGVTRKMLVGAPDGSLIWDGKNILRQTFMSSGSIIVLGAGSNYDKGGACIALRSTTDTVNAGGFSIFANTDDGNAYTLTGSTNGALSWGGTMYASAFQVSSDRRLKSDLKKIDSALEKVSKLAAYTYNKQGVDGRQAGVIAQDVEKVLPEAVRENDEGYKTVDYSALTALLINAINELRSEIHDIKLP